MKLSTILFSLLATLVMAVPMENEGVPEYSMEEYSLLAPRSSQKCAAAPRANSHSPCGVTGTIERPQLSFIVRGVSQQSCANSCTCSNSCHAFSWRQNPKKHGIGACRVFLAHMDQMGYKSGVSPHGQVFWDRNCYHRVAATQTGPIQTTIPKATPKPERRDAHLDVEIARAMAV